MGTEAAKRMGHHESLYMHVSRVALHDKLLKFKGAWHKNVVPLLSENASLQLTSPGAFLNVECIQIGWA